MRVSVYVFLLTGYSYDISILSAVCFQDLAQCVNEVKRDNEIIRQITTFQLSIENMVRVLCFTLHRFHVCLLFSSAHLTSAVP